MNTWRIFACCFFIIFCWTGGLIKYWIWIWTFGREPVHQGLHTHLNTSNKLTSQHINYPHGLEHLCRLYLSGASLPRCTSKKKCARSSEKKPTSPASLTCAPEMPHHTCLTREDAPRLSGELRPPHAHLAYLNPRILGWISIFDIDTNPPRGATLYL